MTDSIDMASLVLGCESEQLHLSGAIQGHGALIVARAEAPFVITHASANIDDFLGIAASDLLGRPIEATGCLNALSYMQLGEHPGQTMRLPRLLQAMGRPCDAQLIRTQDSLLLELEPMPVGNEPIPLQELQKPLLSVPANEDAVAEAHDHLVDAIRSIIGYDRVMVYRFHDDWSGEVVAEATSEALGSYLGLRFPASDIPAIARNLYYVTPYRLIPDIGLAAVPLLGREEAPPDLTLSSLRSVSPVHLQYLANMGVGASFSIPIVISHRLWGLVACHHLTPRTLDFDQRQACVAITRTHALGLTSYFAGRRLHLIDSLERRVDGILEALTLYPDPFDGIEAAAPLFMETLSAHGIAMALDDDVVIVGSAPDMAGMSVIDHWFMNLCTDNVSHTERLASLFPDHPEVAERASGMFAVKVNSPRRGWLRFYWFREAEPREVAWAGNPNKPRVENSAVPMLSPRRSFEKWVEIKTDHSRPWSNEERMIATKFRNTLLRWL